MCVCVCVCVCWYINKFISAKDSKLETETVFVKCMRTECAVSQSFLTVPPKLIGGTIRNDKRRIFQ